jgi:hypothetical protein
MTPGAADRPDTAGVWERSRLQAAVLAALAVGTALLAFRLGRVPAGAETGSAADDGGGTRADR